MIIATHGILANSGGVPIVSDIDAQAFLNAAIITNTTQANAVNQLVLDLKSYSIWSKMKALYPFVGGTATTHKYNLKDPRDLDVAYRLVFNGGWVHSSTGATPNGTTGFADTKLNENNVMNSNNEHLSIYSKTNIDGLYCDIGVSFSTMDSSIFSKYNNIFYPRIQAINNGISNTISSLGLFISNRVSSTEVRAFQNNVLKQITSTVDSKTDGFIFIGAMNRPSAGTAFYSPRIYSFASIGDGLTDTEASNLYTAVNAYQVSLSRNV